MPLDALVTGRVATLAGEHGFGWAEAVGIRGGTMVAGALLENSREWGATVRNSMRGQRYPVRYAVRVGAHPVDAKSGERGLPDDPEVTTADRRRIEQAIFDTLLRTSAQWLELGPATGTKTWAEMCRNSELTARQSSSNTPVLMS